MARDAMDNPVCERLTAGRRRENLQVAQKENIEQQMLLDVFRRGEKSLLCSTCLIGFQFMPV